MGLLKLNAAWIALVAMILSIAIACGSSLENQIVFVWTIDGDEEIYLLDPDNGDIFPLTNNTSKDFNPKLSPDGNHVVYLANESGQSEINLVDIKEEAITRLTHNVGDDQYPQWSPGGERIAYTSLQDDNPEVYLMSAEGGQGTRVTPTPAMTVWAIGPPMASGWFSSEPQMTRKRACGYATRTA